MSRIRRILGVTGGAMSMSYLTLVLNPAQVGLSLTLRPLSRKAFRDINRWAARTIWGYWVVLAEVQNRITINFSGDRPTPQENALVLPNHQSMADVMLLLCLAWRCGRLGDLKVFVKDVVKYVPGVGWGMQFLDCIFVKRNWAEDEAEIHRLFDKFKDDNIPLFLVSFLEGTRQTPEKLLASQRFATERGHFVPTHTLVPRTKGFVATIHGLRDHLDAIYDLTIAYPNEPPPTLVDCFEGNIDRVDIHVRRYTIDELPSSDDELADWARARFEEKDQLLAEYRETGRFPGPPWDAKVRLTDWFRGDVARSAAFLS